MDDSTRFMSLDNLSSCCVGSGQREHEKATAAVQIRFTCGSDELLKWFRRATAAVHQMKFGCGSHAVQTGYCTSSDAVRMRFGWVTAAVHQMRFGCGSDGPL